MTKNIISVLILNQICDPPTLPESLKIGFIQNSGTLDFISTEKGKHSFISATIQKTRNIFNISKTREPIPESEIKIEKKFKLKIENHTFVLCYIQDSEELLINSEYSKQFVWMGWESIPDSFPLLPSVFPQVWKELSQLFQSNSISPTSQVPITLPPPLPQDMRKKFVVHCKKSNYDVYIGRPNPSIRAPSSTSPLPRGNENKSELYKWGNPFVIGKDGDRDQVIQKYENFILSNPELYVSAQRELKGKVLACWCAPLGCHGDILARIANQSSQTQDTIQEHISIEKKEPKRLGLILGSSVGAGSGSERRFGWAQRLEYVLENGTSPPPSELFKQSKENSSNDVKYLWEIENHCVGGFNTFKTINLFRELIESKKSQLDWKPCFVIIALSIMNEGITQRDGNRTIEEYLMGIKKLISMIQSLNAIPIIADVYPSNLYSHKHYQHLLHVHQTLLSLCTQPIPTQKNRSSIYFLDWLKNIEDGNGHWKPNYFHDPNHPNTLGHLKMFESIDLSVFDKIANELKN